MGAVRLRVVQENFKFYYGTRIQQGEICAGSGALGTILGSCICLGFYQPERKIGAISHITGFGAGGAHDSSGALKMIQKELHKYDIDTADCSCFILGGSDRSRRVYDETVSLLITQGIPFENIDILGVYHRKLAFNPATGTITLYKKPIDSTDLSNNEDKKYVQDSGCFHDSKKRIVTGASMFFRNKVLLRKIREIVLPDILTKKKKFHIWCAGCSIGVEVYSIAMVILDWMNKHDCDLLKDMDFKILGTDIADEALEASIKGTYPISRKVLGKMQVW